MAGNGNTAFRFRVTWHIGLADDEQYRLLLESFP